YVLLVFWPQGLTFDYGLRPVTGLAGVPGMLFLLAGGLATILAWVRGGRWLWFGFLGAAFFLLLAPSSSVVPIVSEIAAGPRTFLALAPLLVLAVLGIESLVERLDKRPVDRRPILVRGTTAVILA